MHVRYPVWLRGVASPGAYVFAAIFSLESITRASIATVIPLQIFAVVGSARDVTLLFSAVGVTGLAASFLIPLMIRRWHRRWVYTLGALLLVAAPLLFITVSLAGQVAGLLLRVFGVACLNITLSLYIMDYIRKRDLVRSEPLKLAFAAAAWTFGPSLGVYLSTRVDPASPFAFSAVCAVSVLGLFWLLRLKDSPAVAPATRPPPSPARSVGRFLAQPRLRLAWAIAFSRSAWWSMFFLYAPLLMLIGGEGKEAGALVISAGNATLFLTPLYGRLASRFGVRAVVTAAFLVAASASLAAGISAGSPWAAAGCLLVAALAVASLDAVGNIPFLRAVHPYERPEMTTVFRSYMDFGDLLPMAIFALLLSFLPLASVFYASGLGLIASAAVARYIPRAM